MDFSSLLHVHLVSTLLMVGIIWFVQIVHYPLMVQVGSLQFHEYARLHQLRTTFVVSGPMLLEIGTAILLFSWYPALRSSWSFLAAAVLLVIIWASTIFWQAPLHRALLAGYDERRIRLLVSTNWPRTLAWSLRAILIGELLWPITV